MTKISKCRIFRKNSSLFQVSGLVAALDRTIRDHDYRQQVGYQTAAEAKYEYEPEEADDGRIDVEVFGNSASYACNFRGTL